MKRLLTTLFISSILGASAFGQTFNLDNICMSELTDSIIPTALIDSLFPAIDSIKATGTCDSVTISAKIGTLTLPAAVIKKMNSCSVSVHYTMPTLGKDTIYNFCDLSPVIHAISRHGSSAAPALSLTASGSQLTASGSLLQKADGFTLRLFDQRGRIVQTLTRKGPASASVSWTISSRLTGQLLYVAEQNGKIGAIGKINLTR